MSGDTVRRFRNVVDDLAFGDSITLRVTRSNAGLLLVETVGVVPGLRPGDRQPSAVNTTLTRAISDLLVKEV